jgi:hypothetical protein
MPKRKYGPRICRYERQPDSGPRAFVLVILPESDDPPEPEAHYDLVDPYYTCPEIPICGCPLAAINLRWKVNCVLPGRAFDGRVRGPQPFSHYWPADYWGQWAWNLVRPLEMADPKSAYAVITPDGVWHECIEPEPQDLIIPGQGSPGAPLPLDQLSPLQVAWRMEIAEFLMRYQHCWLLGLEAFLYGQPMRECTYDTMLGPGDRVLR